MTQCSSATERRSRKKGFEPSFNNVQSLDFITHNKCLILDKNKNLNILLRGQERKFTKKC